MTVRIYKPAKSAMQSGIVRKSHWLLEYIQESPGFIEPIMGWIGGEDVKHKQVKLGFATKEKAEQYASREGLDYIVQEPQASTIKIKPYVNNFRK